MKKLIINADDLGLSLSVSRGIEHAHRHGAVTSATLLTNFPAFTEGVRVARENPALGVGVHLNLIRGQPLLSPEIVAPLLEGEFFIRRFWQIGRVCSTAEYLNAAEKEYRAQIEKVLSAGIIPTHLDFEKHHGMWSPLYKLAIKLASEYQLGIRTYREPLIFAWRNLPPINFRAWWLSLHLHFYQKFTRPKNIAPPHSDYFFGQTHIGKISEDYLSALLANFPEASAELMCHPGFRDLDEEKNLSPMIGNSWITENREPELTALCAQNWRAIATDHNIQLITFNEL